jgi:hypothetical protein
MKILGSVLLLTKLRMVLWMVLQIQVVNDYVFLSQFLSESGAQWLTGGLYFDLAESDQ